MTFLLLPASKGWGKVLFSVCLSVHTSMGGRGYPVPGLGGGGTLSQIWWGGGTPSQVWMVGGTKCTARPGLDGVPPTIMTGWGTLPLWLDGYPPTMTGWVTPLHHHDWMGYPSPWLDGVPPIRQSNITSTCYAAGSMPLAFTQEDFVVLYYFQLDASCNFGIRFPLLSWSHFFSWWLVESYLIDGNNVASQLFWEFFHTRWKILFYVRWDWAHKRWDWNKHWKMWKTQKNSKFLFGWRGDLVIIFDQVIFFRYSTASTISKHSSGTIIDKICQHSLNFIAQYHWWINEHPSSTTQIRQIFNTLWVLLILDNQ